MSRPAPRTLTEAQQQRALTDGDRWAELQLKRGIAMCDAFRDQLYCAAEQLGSSATQTSEVRVQGSSAATPAQENAIDLLAAIPAELAEAWERVYGRGSKPREKH